MHSTDQNTIEPYRLFFPISIFGVIAGVSLWIFAWIVERNWIEIRVNPYPVAKHINIMIALFILPVVKGFVLTAIPRFTGTAFGTKREMLFLFFLQITILVTVLFYEDSFLFYSLQTLDFALLFLFITHRFRISKIRLSGYLHFLPGGIFLGLIGSLLQYTNVFFDRNFLFQYGKDFIFYGMVPCIIFGTGTRMVPMIINTESPEKKMQWMQKAESQSVGKYFLILFIASFFLEIILALFLNPFVSIFFKGLRFIICSAWIIKFFHILELSSFKGKLSRLILFSCYMFILGLAGYSFGIQYSSHLAHLYLISGLSLLVLGIMTRVTLSHGGGDMTIEKKSNVFYWIIGFIFLAAITRSSTFLFPEQTTSHLAYAAILYIIGLLFWISKIGKIIFQKG